MAFAFEIPIGGSRAQAFATVVLHLTALTGSIVFSWSLRDLSVPLMLLVLVGLTGAIVWSSWRSMVCGSTGWLMVDEHGGACWRPAHAVRAPSSGESGAGAEAGASDYVTAGLREQPSASWRRAQPRIWGRVGPLAWIVMSVDGERVVLLSGADRCSDDQWRAQCAWLRWLDRSNGRADGRPGRADDRFTQEPLGNSGTRPNL